MQSVREISSNWWYLTSSVGFPATCGVMVTLGWLHSLLEEGSGSFSRTSNMAWLNQPWLQERRSMGHVTRVAIVETTARCLIFSSLAPGRCGSNFAIVFLKLNLRIGIMGASFEIGLRWVPCKPIDGKSTLVMVMAGCTSGAMPFPEPIFTRGNNSINAFSHHNSNSVEN